MLKEQSKQEKRSLERILELTKQFYVEKKSVRIMEKLEQLAEEQLELSNEEEINSQEQDELNKKFDSIQQEFDELREQNESLKEPMPLHDSKADEKLIEMEMDKAKKDLEKSESEENSEENKKEDEKKKNASSSAKKNQKSASKRMKELSGKMKSGMMAMEMQGVQENIEDLQQILKNLVLFSEDQEKLMMDLEYITDRNAEFPAKLKEQVKLKEHFEHIDDSLYTLSMRVVTLSSEIEKDLTEAHYNLNKSLENLSENRIKQGRSNQQYTMVAANNLADMLSNMLESLQNQQPGSGQGSGKEEELSLPDIIKKQQGLSKKMQQEMKGKGSEGQKEQEELSGQQFRMYQEQQMIKEELKKILDEQGEKSGNGKKALDAMEELERILLEKGVTQESIERMQKLEYELLELENASIKQNKDAKREATTNRREYEKGRQEDIQWDDFKGQEKEILRRENIKLSPDYQKRVKFYFEKRTDSL